MSASAVKLPAALDAAGVELLEKLGCVEKAQTRIAELDTARKKAERDMRTAKATGNVASPSTAKIIREHRDHIALIGEEAEAQQPVLLNAQKDLRPAIGKAAHQLQDSLGRQVSAGRDEMLKLILPFFASVERARQVVADADAFRHRTRWLQNLNEPGTDPADDLVSAKNLLGIISKLSRGEDVFPNFKGCER